MLGKLGRDTQGRITNLALLGGHISWNSGAAVHAACPKLASLYLDCGSVILPTHRLHDYLLLPLMVSPLTSVSVLCNAVNMCEVPDCFVS